jgi:hypothetical protein
MGLTEREIEEFERSGFLLLRGAIPPDVVAACRADIATALREEGVDLDDRTTWSRPVVRIPTPMTEAFRAAGGQPIFASVADDLLGAGAWHRHPALAGTVPVRFPHPDDPGDAGWHVDGSYEGADGTYWLNVASRDRGLLLLVLFDEVSAEDAPTELKVGSHLDVPQALQRYRAQGASVSGWSRSCRPPPTSARPRSPPARPATCSSATRSWCTAPRGPIAASGPGRWHNRAWPRSSRSASTASTRAPWNERSSPVSRGDVGAEGRSAQPAAASRSRYARSMHRTSSAGSSTAAGSDTRPMLSAPR